MRTKVSGNRAKNSCKGTASGSETCAKHAPCSDMGASLTTPGKSFYDEQVGFSRPGASPGTPMRRSDGPHVSKLPVRSMVGQLPLEQHIGVRIPDGQPNRIRNKSTHTIGLIRGLSAGLSAGAPRLPIEEGPGRGSHRCGAGAPGNIPDHFSCRCLRRRW